MHQPYKTLNNGIQMPQIGLGVWQAQGGAEVEGAVSAALTAGYRLIDTASVYGNETGVGRAVKKSGILRSNLFITTKVWNADQGYRKTLLAFEKSLSRLGLTYIDLYLIDWPSTDHDNYIETWHALEKLYRDGRIRAIGVSNFTPEHLDRLIKSSRIIPAVNQIELHPHFPQYETRAFCDRHGIAVESYSPLGSSKGDLLHSPLLRDIAQQHNKSPAQVMVRWHIQNNLIVIPKSVHPERIVENIDVLDFELSESDMRIISTLDTNQRIGADPEMVNFVFSTRMMRLAHVFRLVHW